jgi:hypothetical protein
MKVITMVDLGSKEIEVEIDAQDAVNAILEGCEDMTPERAVLRACNNFIVFLRKLPDEAIVLPTEHARKIIADALDEQVKRLRKGLPA